MDNTCDDDDDDLLLPHDALIQILLYLPVKSLLRFKSVCKSWRDLIESSFFIYRHAATTNTLRSSSKFGTFIFQIFHVTSDYTVEDEILMVSSRPGSGDGDDDEEVFEVKSLGFPPHYKVSHKNHNIFMVGSCNGLICLHNSILKDVSLWNPATKQFRILPKSLNLEGIGDLVGVFVAFGFDIKTKDYKVVHITTFTPYKCGDSWLPTEEEFIFRVQVYSFSTDSWRLLEGINYLPAIPQQDWPRNHGLYFNGSYIFQGTYFNRVGGNGRLILSFDFTKEIFTTIEFLNQDITYVSNLSYLGEKIAMFARVASGGDRHYVDYDIWVLNEHGVRIKESWTKLHSITEKSTLSPIGIPNNGEFAFLETKSGAGDAWNRVKLELFNLVTKEAIKVFPTSNTGARADVYKQTLVSIHGNGAAEDDKVCISDKDLQRRVKHMNS